MKETIYDKLIGVCLKRGIFYPSSEIYNPTAGFYDYGSVGSKIKRNWEDYWRRYFLKSLGEPFFEIESCAIMPEKVFEASGHLKEFVDPVTECKKCGLIERADQIVEGVLGENYEGMTPKELDKLIRKHNVRCPHCKGELKEVGVLSLMFGFNVGPYSTVKGYLRPETAQGVYVSFKREYLVNRERLPLGLAIVGRAYRNEISPRQGLFRMREFSQAELQVFFDPDDMTHPQFKEVENYKLNIVAAKERKKGIQEKTCKQLVGQGYPEKFIYYAARIQQFYESLGVEKQHFRLFEKNKEERAFYNALHIDIEVYSRSFDKFLEVAGLHYRTDHDLKGHQKVSGNDMSVKKDGKKFIPHVIELSFGSDRNVFALLDLGFRSDERTYISLPPQIAPYIAGIYPLVKKDGLDKEAQEIFRNLRENMDVWYDEGGSIGRRYARSDEIGIFLGITVDHESLEKNDVTLRDRNSTEQKRIPIKALEQTLFDIRNGKIDFKKL